MDQIDQRYQQGQTDQMDQINLLDYWKVVWKWRKMIVVVTLTCMVVAGLLGLRGTRVYKAETTFFITRKSQGRVVQSGGGVAVVSEPSEVYGEVFNQMVKSKDLAQKVITELNLTSIWGIKRVNDCESILKNKLKIVNLGPKGYSGGANEVFNLSITDQDPQLALRITESYLQNLQDVNTQMNVQMTKNSLKFIEDRMAEAKEALSKAENELRDFKERYGITELKQQSSLIVQRVAEFQIELAKAEAELDVLSSQYTEYEPQVIRARMKVARLRAMIKRLQGADVNSVNGSATDSLAKDPSIEVTTVKNIPELTLKLGQLEQNVQIQNDIYKSLVVQYESNKIEATKQARILQVIDQPRVPEVPEPRKIKQNTMLAGMVGLMLTLMLTFLLEYIIKNTDPSSLPKSISKIFPRVT